MQLKMTKLQSSVRQHPYSYCVYKTTPSTESDVCHQHPPTHPPSIPPSQQGWIIAHFGTHAIIMPYIYAPTRAGAGLSHHALKQSFHPSKAVGRLVIEKLTKETQPAALLSAGEHRRRAVPGTHHRDPLRPPLIVLALPPSLLRLLP
jgi:hypothetical protein